MHAWSAPPSRGADHALLPLLLTRGLRPRISCPPLTSYPTPLPSFPRRREPNVLRPTTYPPHPVVSRTHPRHSRVGGNPTSCVRRRIHGDTPAPQGHRLHSQNGSWMARPDSRLRGNDGVRAGNDGVGAGNDGMDTGNDGMDTGNDGGALRGMVWWTAGMTGVRWRE